MIATGPGGTGSATVTIAVGDTSPAIAYKRASISGTKNVAILSDTVVLTGTGAITGYSLSGGSTLPSGVLLSTLTGVISGTPTVTYASTVDTVVATGPGGTGRATVTIAVSDTSPSISYKRATINGTKNVAILADTIVVSGTGSITGYTISSPLPSGLNFNLATGVISGAANVISSATNYTVTASGPGGSGVAVVNIAIADTAPVISYKRSSITGTKNVAILPDTVVIVGTGSITGYSVSPALPLGINLSPVSGLISGTPTVVAAGNYTVTAAGPGGSGQSVVNVAISDTSPAITYKRASITGTRNSAIIPDTLVVTGSGIITGYAISAALPAGLSFNLSDGMISGTPSVAVSSTNYTVTASGPGGSGISVVNVTIGDIAPSISYVRATISATKNVAITPDTAVSTGGAVTGYSVTPALPAGLVIDSLTGLVSGTGTVATASANYSVIATGPGGLDTAVVSIAVADNTPILSYVRSSITGIKHVAITPDTAVATGGANGNLVQQLLKLRCARCDAVRYAQPVAQHIGLAWP